MLTEKAGRFRLPAATTITLQMRELKVRSADQESPEPRPGSKPSDFNLELSSLLRLPGKHLGVCTGAGDVLGLDKDWKAGRRRPI